MFSCCLKILCWLNLLMLNLLRNLCFYGAKYLASCISKIVFLSMINFSLCANFPWRILLRRALLKFDRGCNNLEWRTNALVKWNYEENVFLYQIHELWFLDSVSFSHSMQDYLIYNPCRCIIGLLSLICMSQWLLNNYLYIRFVNIME